LFIKTLQKNLKFPISFVNKIKSIILQNSDIRHYVIIYSFVVLQTFMVPHRFVA
jgi:hypothetical protein